MQTMTINGERYIKESDIPKTKIGVSGADKSNPFMVIGMDFFIRTVTHYFTGRLVWVGEKEIALEDVCWIADTGRFNEFISGKTYNETEPFPKGQIVIIGRGSIIDMTEKIGGLIQVIK